MAGNLLWLAGDCFAGRKIIVWGATSHLSRNRDRLETSAANDMVPMGQEL